MKNNRIKYNNKLFDLEARLDNDYETGETFWVSFEFGPMRNWPNLRDEDYKVRRYIWQFYAHTRPWHIRFSDRDKLRK